MNNDQEITDYKVPEIWDMSFMILLIVSVSCLLIIIIDSFFLSQELARLTPLLAMLPVPLVVKYSYYYHQNLSFNYLKVPYTLAMTIVLVMLVVMNMMNMITY
ncbi:MAG: hypothetical protein AAFN93_04905 [Bacteroidota bacterium]